MSRDKYDVNETSEPVSNSDIYAAMYGVEDEAPAPAVDDTGAPRIPERGIMNMASLSAEIRRLSALVEAQARQIRRLEGRCNALERQNRGRDDAIAAVRRDLAGKLDAY